MNGGLDQPSWREPRLYAGYLKDVQRFYEREPIIQISVQLILSIFAVAFFTFAAIRPTLATISTLLKKIEDLETLSTRLDTKITQLGRAQEILATQGPLLERVSETTIPMEPQLDRLSKAMEVLANEHGVYFTAIDFQTTPLTAAPLGTPSGSLATSQEQLVTFNFSVVGTQERLISFLEDLENMDRAVLLTKLTLAEPELNYRRVFPVIATGRATVYYLP